jgi:hypothetical protein
MKRFLIVYLSTLVVLLPSDLVFLSIVGKKHSRHPFADD